MYVVRPSHDFPFVGGGRFWLLICALLWQSLHRPMLEVLGLVDLHYVVGALLFAVAVMGVLAGHLRHHLLLQVRSFFRSPARGFVYR